MNDLSNTDTLIHKSDTPISDTSTTTTTTTVQDTQQQQQDSSNSSNNNKEDEIDLDLDHDVDSTLERVREKRQKEREEKLASMMSQYHRKYSSPSEPNSPIRLSNNNNDDNNDEQDKIGKRNIERSRRKDDLAEQMKKYRDQYENIISGVNTILSSPSTSSNNSSSNVSPVLFSTTPTIDKQYEKDLDSSQNNNININNNSSSNDNSNDNNNNNNSNSNIENNFYNTYSIPTIVNIEEPEPNSNEEIKEQEQEQIEQQQQQQQLHPIHPIDIDRILFFERQDIPFLTDVGFKTLKGIEQDAMRCSDALITLTHGLNNSLLNMTKMSVELFGAFQMSNDSLSSSIGTSIAETESMIDKCIELNQQTKPIHQLFQKIKSIKDTIDKFDTVVHNVVKQLDKQDK